MDHFTTLTPKQALFCAEYFVDFNATKAALRAGYSPATALSGKLMTIPKIKMHLQERGAKLHEDMEVNNQAVLDELKKIAFATMGDYLDADGKIKPMNLVSDDAKAALANYSVTEGKYGPSVKIRLGNKLTALEKIARLLNFYGGPRQEVNYWILDGRTADAEDGLDDVGLEQGTRSKEQGHDVEKNQEAVCSEQGTRSKEQGQGIEADIERRIAEAVAETERRLRAEFALQVEQLEQGTKSKEQGQIVELKNTDFYHPVLENQESSTGNQDENGEMETAGQVVGDNTNNGGDPNNGSEEGQEARDKNQEENSGEVVGDSTNNGGNSNKSTNNGENIGVKKERRYRTFSVKAAPLKRNVKYLRIY